MTKIDPAEPALIASQNVASENFDDETVLISIEKGNYFSLRGAASQIWTMCREARTPTQIVAAFGLTPGSAEALAVEKTVADMQANDVLVPAPEAATSLLDSAPFAPPSFEVFSDLAELISIDPVHDVQMSAGWPVRPDGFPSPVG